MTSRGSDPDGIAGIAAESNVRQVAADLGVADFVYLPKRVRRGAAEKEVSDGILMCGEHGAILQVKSRGKSSLPVDDEAAAGRWATRELRVGVKQARWSRKELLRRFQSAEPVLLRPVRALGLPEQRHHEFDYELTVSPSTWPLIVVLDHPRLQPFEAELDDDVFAITRHDWVQLMRAVRSVAGVLEYVRRCLEHRGVLNPGVGREFDRFAALCAADAGTDDDGPTWGPWLSFAALADPGAADTYQHLINRCWPAGSPLPAVALGDWRRVSEFLDQVPPSVRVSVGARWRTYAQHTKDGGQASGMTILPDKSIFILLHHELEQELPPAAMRNRLTAIAQIRWWEVSRFGPRPLLAIGVFTHPGATDYLFVLIDDPEEPDDRTRTMVEADIGVLQVPDDVGRLRRA